MKKIKWLCILLSVAVIFSFGLRLRNVSADPAEQHLTVSLDGPYGEGNVGGEVSMPNGWAGMQITVGDEDIQVLSVGRWYTAGSNLTHNFLIANMDGSLVMQYGQAVTNATEGQADGFVYAPVTGGDVILQANTSYYFVSDYWGDTDKFYAHNPIVACDDISVDGIVIGTYSLIAGTANNSWGPLDLTYIVLEEEESESEPESTEPESTEPESTEPESTEPESTEPESTEPESTEPEPEEPEYVERAFTTGVELGGPGNVGADVNMPAGWAGMRITVGYADVTVTRLGRWYTPDSNASHNLMIAAEDGTILGTAAVGTRSSEGFVYGNLAGGPITLRAGQRYYIIGDFWGPNDKFYAGAVQRHTSVATIDGIAIVNAAGGYDFFEAENTGWGPVDFCYLALPNTGDSSLLTVSVVLILSFGALAVLLSKRRRNA